MQDRIEKTVDIQAPVERVWRALTDHREFGEWFRVKLDSAFVVGRETRGQVTYEGYEHLEWKATVRAMETNRYFAFAWYPYSDNDSDKPEAEHGEKPETLVEFTLTPNANGTTLTICESGFSALGDTQRREEAFRENTNGWDIQAANIANYAEG